ncbi:MAG: sulfatase-like hydrolase/transferase [Luteitalea sp.]|nr:sulfatase-like hydrolase/transferase [Luteitalea sp.]
MSRRDLTASIGTALIAALLGAVVTGAGSFTGHMHATGQRSSPANRHVILISIDGFAAFHLANEAIDLPNIRALAKAGAVAESSETVFPSVTHPSHTTLVTGVTPRRHGVVGNNVTDRRTGERFHITNLPRRQSVRVPTLFDAVKRAGHRTAAFFWPETRDDSAIDDNIAEVFLPEGGADPRAVTPGLLDELRRAGVPIDTYYAFYDDPFGHGAGDLALTQAAAHVFADRTPALMATHLLVTDKVQHEFGPAHYLSWAALTTADRCVGLLRQAVAEAGLADRTTFVIAADHGFVTVRHEMNVAPLVAEPSLDGRVRWRTNGWFLFAEKTESFDPARDGPVLERVLKRLGSAPGIARVIGPGDMAALGFPDYDLNPYARGHYIVAADIDTHLVLDPDNPSTVRRLMAEPYHGHGYLPDHPAMYPALVLSGAGISPGVRLGHVRNVDVAPTIAALLRVELFDVDGRVLREALR